MCVCLHVLILFLFFFSVLQGAYMYLVSVSHVCVFASVFYAFVAVIGQNK